MNKQSEISKQLRELLEANPKVQLFGIMQNGNCVGLDSVDDNDKLSMIKDIEELIGKENEKLSKHSTLE